MASKYFYQAEVRNIKLGKYKIVKAETAYELDQKVRALEYQWNEQERRIIEKEKKIQNVEDSLKYAHKKTAEADRVQKSIDDLLVNSLAPIMLDFNEMKDNSEYSIARPQCKKMLEFPSEPHTFDSKYNPKPSLLVKLSKKKFEKFNMENKQMFKNDHDRWEETVCSIEEKNARYIEEYNHALDIWQTECDNFYHEQDLKNKEIDDFEKEFEKAVPAAIEKYFKILLENVEWPFSFEKDVDLEYQQNGKRLIVDILLPNLNELPSLKSVSYVKVHNEFRESYFTENQMKKKYDNFIYQVTLQTINYIFTTKPELELVDTIVLNGRVSTIDKATGKGIEPCILSVNVGKEAFEDINLEMVDAKAWFKSAKGISAATIANITPVAPIVQIEREDKRFVEGYAVANNLDDSMNLAAMDWQDFENLIREIFEKEFNTNGGEVKITQASRDGGVDAVAFDPDPIRGGKIVIQAKRYTNVVGVSAVRDLYGTLMNEGANKGILVTTANYGSDAYEFAAGKPITLMNGANLLHLLEKHGHKARIDLVAAKKFFADQNNI